MRAPGDLPERLWEMGIQLKMLFTVNAEWGARHGSLADALVQAANESRLTQSEEGVMEEANRAGNNAKHANVYPLRTADIRGGPREELWRTAIVCAPVASDWWDHFDHLARGAGNEERLTVVGVGDCLMRRQWPPLTASDRRSPTSRPEPHEPLPPPWGPGRSPGPGAAPIPPSSQTDGRAADSTAGLGSPEAGPGGAAGAPEDTHPRPLYHISRPPRSPTEARLLEMGEVLDRAEERLPDPSLAPRVREPLSPPWGQGRSSPRE